MRPDVRRLVVHHEHGPERVAPPETGPVPGVNVLVVHAPRGRVLVRAQAAHPPLSLERLWRVRSAGAGAWSPPRRPVLREHERARGGSSPPRPRRHRSERARRGRRRERRVFCGAEPAPAEVHERGRRRPHEPTNLVRRGYGIPSRKIGVCSRVFNWPPKMFNPATLVFYEIREGGSVVDR